MKKAISILVAVVFTVLIANFTLNKSDLTVSDDREARSERIASVIDNAWDEFNLLSFQITQTDSIIWIEMDENNSDLQLREYLENNIGPSDLSHYDIKVFKRNLEEVETEHTMHQIERIVWDYIKEKNYNDVQVHYPSIEPDPMLEITISEASEKSSEDLKSELDNLVDSKRSELTVKDVSYDIQVYK